MSKVRCLNLSLFAPDVIGPMVAQGLTEKAKAADLPVRWSYDPQDGLQMRAA